MVLENVLLSECVAQQSAVEQIIYKVKNSLSLPLLGYRVWYWRMCCTAISECVAQQSAVEQIIYKVKNLWRDNLKMCGATICSGANYLQGKKFEFSVQKLSNLLSFALVIWRNNLQCPCLASRV